MHMNYHVHLHATDTTTNCIPRILCNSCFTSSDIFPRIGRFSCARCMIIGAHLNEHIHTIRYTIPAIMYSLLRYAYEINPTKQCVGDTTLPCGSPFWSGRTAIRWITCHGGRLLIPDGSLAHNFRQLVLSDHRGCDCNTIWRPFIDQPTLRPSSWVQLQLGVPTDSCRRCRN